MNKFWGIMIIVSIIYSLFTNRIEIINNSILNVAEDTFNFVLPLVLITSFWNGILYVAKDGGLLNKLEYLLHPILKKILPDIKNDNETLQYVSANIIANMFGLGSAATPMGLKAIEGMQKHNQTKDSATRSMVTFLVLNTAGVTIIPTTIIALRNTYHSKNSTNFIFCAVIATFLASLFGLLMDRIINYYVK